MKISVLTLFPDIFNFLNDYSIIGRAIKNKIVDIEIINIRDFSTLKHKTVDDKPYSGGVGMLMKVDVLDRAISYTKKKSSLLSKIILLDPKGKTYNQKIAAAFSSYEHLILICGHYEGVDDRIKYFIDQRISIGKYILSGGEIPALVVIDSTIRLLPGVLKNTKATIDESYSRDNLLEYPQYTRPRIYKGFKVPQVLISGNHKKIENWRLKNIIKPNSSKI